MFEFLFFALVIYLFLNRRKRKKKLSIDAELQEIISTHNYSRETATEIRDFLLTILNSDAIGDEKFSDEHLALAQKIIDRGGASAMYWMTDIAAQMTLLAAAQINEIPTNIETELARPVTPQDIVTKVVRV